MRTRANRLAGAIAALGALVSGGYCLGAEPAADAKKPHAEVNLRAGPQATQALHDEI